LTIENNVGIIAKILKFETHHVFENLESPEIWDSFSRIEVIVALEDELGVSFSIEEISKISTVGQLLDALKRKA
jgi:acyl carrier protein